MKFQHTLHRKLWLWLADNPEKSKEDWPEWDYNGGTVEKVKHLCFACEYIEETIGGCYGDKGLLECPLNTTKESWGWCLNELFGDWMNSTGQTRANLARTIAELPVREGVECI